MLSEFLYGFPHGFNHLNSIAPPIRGSILGSGATPMLCAAENGHEAAVKLLLAKTSVRTPREGWRDVTPVFLSSSFITASCPFRAARDCGVQPKTLPMLWAAVGGYEGGGEVASRSAKRGTVEHRCSV
jgi:hypothetical protein